MIKLNSDGLCHCRTCNKLFDPKAKSRQAGGYIDECSQCGHADTKQKFLGRQGATHKGEGVEIFRDNLEFYKVVLRRETCAGMSPNLGISSTVNPVGRELKGE